MIKFPKLLISALLASLLLSGPVMAGGQSGIYNPFNGGTVSGNTIFNGTVTTNGAVTTNSDVNMNPTGTHNVTISPTGTGTVTISPVGGAVTIASPAGSTGLMDNVDVGDITPAAVTIKGQVGNTGVAAGIVGETLSSNIAVGTPVALVSATSKDITSLSLTGGNWDVWGTVCFVANAATTATIFQGGISTVLNTLATPPGGGASYQLTTSVAAGALEPCFPVGSVINNNVATTMHLVANSTFAVNTMSAYGYIAARRRQ